MSSSEDVLLIVQNVKLKKSEGRLYLMGSRLAWMGNNSNNFSVSQHYTDIRSQKISPDTKEKVQLQIVMHDGSARTWHFTNPGGRSAQVHDRDAVKELLQQLLPKFRSKVNSELEHKNRMLQEDPELFQLYKDLVVSGIVPADEFWNNRKNNSSGKNSKQEIGVSGAFLSDIKQTDGCNGLKYNLTADTIEAIFTTYPAVKAKHAEHVPHNLSESEFWTRFFQSHYFHRDRINFTNKEIFAECAKHDETVMAEETERKKDDPLVDLVAMSDGIQGDGYGSEREVDRSAVSAAAAANTSLIRRFNHHSTMVLRAADKHGTTEKDARLNGAFPASSTSPSSSGHRSNSASTSNGHATDLHGQPPPPKKARLREKLEYEDLGGTPGNSGAGSKGHVTDGVSPGPALRLHKTSRYLHGPTPAAAGGASFSYTSSEDVMVARSRIAHDLMAWQQHSMAPAQILPSGVAATALAELSPGGALMHGYTQQQLHQLVPEPVQLELKNLYNALCELLRHFWSCFPTNTPFLEEKVVRMRANLEKFQATKMNPLKERLAATSYLTFNLVGHMEEMLAAAFAKFSAWQARRASKR